MSQVVIGYAWGRANAGDLAISLGGLELITKCVPGDSIWVISRYTRGVELDSAPYLQSRFPEVKILSSPFRSNRRNRLATLLEHVHGMILVGTALVWPQLAMTVSRQNEALKAIARADVVLINGGNLLYWNRHRKAIGRLVALVFPALLARRLGKPYGFLPQSMGPFESGIVGRLVGWLLEGARFVLFREFRSHEHASAIADLSKTVTAVVPDLAFFMEIPLDASDNMNEDDGKIVAVTLRASKLGDPDTVPDCDEVERVARRVARIVAAVTGRYRGMRVLAVQQTIADEAVTKAFAARFTELTGQDVTVKQELDPVALAKIYRRATVLVGMRLHSLVFALAQRTPALGLYLERFGPKVAGTFEQLGMGRYSVNLETTSDQVVIQRLEELLVDRTRIRRELDRELRHGEAQMRRLLSALVAQLD